MTPHQHELIRFATANGNQAIANIDGKTVSIFVRLYDPAIGETSVDMVEVTDMAGARTELGY